MANILIVGTNQGIGYYLTERLLALGNSVTVLDISIEAVEKLRTAYPNSVLPIVADVNFLGALRLSKTVLPLMRKARKGRIIFTSSGVGVTGFAGISPYAASKGAMESLAKCLEIENMEYGISFHLFLPPLTDTKSAARLPIPKEFKADARKVGYGLADNIWSKKFVICHSLSQAVQMKFSYWHPLFIGKLMTKMTKRAMDAQ